MSFLDHATACGLILDYPIADGRWHRCKTVDKPKKRNGAYVFDGHDGAVRNWATMPHFSVYREGKVKRVGNYDFRVVQRKAREQQESRWLDARNVAADMLSRARWESHPYLIRKGFPAEAGFVLDGELLVPMRDMRDAMVLNSLQRITEDGEKRFLSGGRAKGSVLKLGNERARERWLVEGYATGLSVREALRDLRRSYQVIVVFSAGNLTHVATMVKPPAFVMADHDESKAGQQAAEATGLPWVMPPGVGTDANDLHQGSGLRALVKLVRSIDHQELVREMRAMRS